MNRSRKKAKNLEVALSFEYLCLIIAIIISKSYLFKTFFTSKPILIYRENRSHLRRI